MDVYASYASNEIAINWNALLVFLRGSLLPEYPLLIQLERAKLRPPT
jgi:hypothetical protein